MSPTSGTIQDSTGIKFKASSVQGIFETESSDTTIATVSPSKNTLAASSLEVKITGVKNGTATIKVIFTPTDTKNYNSPGDKTYTVTVNMYHTLTVKPNGGEWNSTSSDSTFTQVNGTTKSIGNPSKNAYYTVSYNGNGGSTPSATTAYRSFSSWSLSGGGTFSNGTYTFGTQNGTLTANYNSTSNSTTLASSSKSYTIIYNTNSTSATGSASSQSATVGGLGWYDAASGGNKIADFGGSATFTANKTLYAHWNSESNAMTLATISKNGSTCKWNTKSDGSGTPYSSGQTNVKFSASTTLYAICTVNNYTVTIGRNNTSYGTVSATSVSIPYGTTYSTSGGTLTFSNGTKVTATATAATGYTTTFSSWSPSSGTITSATTITANFTRNINTLCIKFNLDEGTLNTNREGVTVDSSGYLAYNGNTCLSSGNYNSTDINLPNTNNKSFVYIELTHHSIISGKEWCKTATGGGGCYNDDTNYKASDFADLSKSSQTIVLYPNWDIYVTSGKTSSYTLPSVCSFKKQTYRFNINWNVDDSPASGKICYAGSSSGTNQAGCYNYSSSTLGKCASTGYGGAYFEKTHSTTSKKWYYYRSTSYVYGYVKTTNGKTASKTQG